ncbi:MAG: GyrI-like domain-containing protein [Chloroflexota bacterium]
MTGIAFERPTTAAEEFAGKPGAVRFLEPLARRFVMIDGEGPAGEAAFAPRMPGLYGTAYPLRFALKRRGVDEKVRPLEGLWWTQDGRTDLDVILGGDADRANWRWTLMIGLPEAATEDEVAGALASGRGKLDAPHAQNLRVQHFAEGPSAQVLHLGPYATERATIEALHAAIEAAGLVPTGRHHELYLGDPQRSAPDKLKTLLRMPVRPA